jgi:hypothetical protein
MLFAVNADFPYISDDALGIILMLAGLATIGLAFALQHQRNNTSHVARVEERRFEGP